MKTHKGYDELYTYTKPSSSTSYFNCIYQIKDSEPITLPKDHYALPDGFPEIVINLGNTYYREDLLTKKKETIYTGTCVIIGQKLRSVRIIQEGTCNIITLKLKPYGLYFLLGSSQFNILNRTVLANDLLGKEILDLIKLLSGRNEKINLDEIQSFFEEKLNIKFADESIVEIVDFITKSKGLVRIEEICDRFSIGQRTLENHFKNKVGISPKEFCSIIQFNHFLIQTTEKTSLAESAFASGYYDQSHLIHKFKTFAHTSPKKHLRNLNILSGINLEVLRRQLTQ